MLCCIFHKLPGLALDIIMQMDFLQQALCELHGVFALSYSEFQIGSLQLSNNSLQL